MQPLDSQSAENLPNNSWDNYKNMQGFFKKLKPGFIQPTSILPNPRQDGDRREPPNELRNSAAESSGWRQYIHILYSLWLLSEDMNKFQD